MSAQISKVNWTTIWSRIPHRSVNHNMVSRRKRHLALDQEALLEPLLRKQEAEIRVVPHRSLNQLPPEMGKDKHLGKAQVGRTEKILEWFSCN